MSSSQGGTAEHGRGTAVQQAPVTQERGYAARQVWEVRRGVCCIACPAAAADQLTTAPALCIVFHVVNLSFSKNPAPIDPQHSARSPARPTFPPGHLPEIVCQLHARRLPPLELVRRGQHSVRSMRHVSVQQRAPHRRQHLPRPLLVTLRQPAPAAERWGGALSASCAANWSGGRLPARFCWKAAQPRQRTVHLPSSFARAHKAPAASCPPTPAPPRRQRVRGTCVARSLCAVVWLRSRKEGSRDGGRQVNVDALSDGFLGRLQACILGQPPAPHPPGGTARSGEGQSVVAAAAAGQRSMRCPHGTASPAGWAMQGRQHW